jgi:hypothetical protein
MLALYRSGRQVDALDVYRGFRKTLVDELGLEPGPALRDLERRILEQDPTLRDAGDALPPLPRTRRVRLAFVTIAAMLAVGLVAALVSGEPDRSAAAPAHALAVIDPRAGRVVQRLGVAADPVAVAVGDGAVWVASARDEVLQRVDPTRRMVVRTVGIGATPSAVATGPGIVWIANGADGTLTRVEAGTGTVAETVLVRPRFTSDFYARPAPSTLAVGTRRVWTNRDLGTISRIGTAGGRPRVADLGGGRSADAMALGFGALWVTSGEDAKLYRLDPERLGVTGSVPLPGKGPAVVTAGAEAVWVGVRGSGRILRIDPRSLRVTEAGAAGPDVVAIAVGAGSVWTLSDESATVTQHDPRTGRVVSRIGVGGRPTSLAAGAGAVWVTTTTASPAGPPGGPLRPVRSTACRPVYYGGQGAPSRLVVLDIPVHWADAPGIATGVRREIDAVRDAVRRRGFRAGRFTVGLQVCDDSTRRAGYWTEERCRANARAYVETRAVAGIIGPVHSGCARLQLPIASRAAGGAPPQLSYSTTYLGLTRPGPGTAPGEPHVYGEQAERAFVRLAGPDDAQGVALAQLARRLGAARAFVLDDGSSGGITAARAATAALAALEVDTGTAEWDAARRSYRALAERIRRAEADAVIIAGCICANAGRLLRDLRAVLPRDTPLLGSDLMSMIGPPGVPAPSHVMYLREEAGGAAIGTYVMAVGPLPQHLGAPARDLAERIGPMPSMDTGNAGQIMLAGQATEVLLEAVARSDGRRASVRQELREGGFETLAGPARFDARGDMIAPRFTAYRVDAASVTPVPIDVDADLLARVRRDIGSL